MKSFFSKWKGEFDTSNVYQVTWLRYHFKKDFIPIHYPIHRNTGIRVHDVLINKQNEDMLNTLVRLNLPVEILNQIFLFSIIAKFEFYLFGYKEYVFFERRGVES